MATLARNFAILTWIFLCSVVACQGKSYYSVAYVGNGQPVGTTVQIQSDILAAEQDPIVLRERLELSKLELEMATAAPIAKQRKRVKQALLAAQESKLPNWAKWKPFRPPSTPGEGSYKDWKTSMEDNSADSLTWLNEFFHPAAFVDRVTRSGTNENNTVYYQDYEPRTGTPYDISTHESMKFFTNAKLAYGNSTLFRRISELDNRPERLFLRNISGPCRYSVPFFMEPQLKHEEGVHFFITANAQLLTTAFTPCDHFCSEYTGGNKQWPGIYLTKQDLDPTRADHRLSTLNPSRSLDDIDRKDEERFSGIWIDRYVYQNVDDSVGVATHAGTADGRLENMADPQRQVSVVVTYENIPIRGVSSKSNFTGQLELFTNGTILIRFRSLGSTKELADPILSFTESFSQRAGIRFNAFPDNFDSDYNNTNLINLPIIAARFDLLEFLDHKSAAGIATSGRCGTDKVLESVIPSGHRIHTVRSIDQNWLATRCSFGYDCGRCVSINTGVSPKCVWCPGMRSADMLYLNALNAGSCMTVEEAAAYCIPTSVHTMRCDTLDASDNTNIGEHYSATTTALPDWRSQNFLDMYNRLPTQNLDEIIAVALAATMRHGHHTIEYVTRNNSILPSGNIDLDTRAPYLVGPVYLRRQKNEEVSQWLQFAKSLAVGKRGNASADCYPAEGTYYGRSLTWPDPPRTRFRLSKGICTLPFGQRNETPVELSDSVNHLGIFPDEPIGLQLFSPSNSRQPALQLSLSDIKLSPVGFHICHLEHARHRLNNQEQDASSDIAFTTIHRNVIRPLLRGQFDIFLHVRSDGGISMGCLTSTAPTASFYGRMVSGADPFNVWYLQEAIPPASTFLPGGNSDSLDILKTPARAHMKPLSVRPPFAFKPGRLVTFTPQKVCPKCVKGTCIKAVCYCEKGFVGEHCNRCAASGTYFDKETLQCVKCSGHSDDQACIEADKDNVKFILGFGLSQLVLLGGGVIGVYFCVRRRRRIEDLKKSNAGQDNNNMLTTMLANPDFVGPPVSTVPLEMWVNLRREASSDAIDNIRSMVAVSDPAQDDEGSVDFL